MFPYSEPYALNTSLKSPFYKGSHEAFRKKVRAFIDDHVAPHVALWERAGKFPDSLRRQAYAAGVYTPGWPARYGGSGCCTPT